MKILRNKTYQGMVDKEVKLRKENNELKSKNELNERKLYEYQIVEHSYIAEINILKEENHKLLGAKGGYIKEINKLKKQVEELTFKLEESMTDKYLVKKIKPGRTPKGPQMKIKDCSRISNISRKVFGKQWIK